MHTRNKKQIAKSFEIVYHQENESTSTYSQEML